MDNNSNKFLFNSPTTTSSKVIKNKILTIENLSLYYKDVQILNSINLYFNENEVTSIIGPSGCGKSTLLKCLNRLNDFEDNCKVTGRVIFENNNIYHKKTKLIELRKKIGMVFQKPNVFPMSIYDNVAYALRIHGIKNKKLLDPIIKNALVEAVLWDEVCDRLKANATSLSGGQQQRLCIARAIALKPKILLMDEPTSALDPVATSSIEELITKLSNNYSIILVTHHMKQATKVSHNTAFLLKGELIEFNKTKTFFLKPSDKRTEAYISGKKLI